MEIAVMVKTQEATVKLATKLLTMHKMFPNIQSLCKHSHPIIIIRGIPKHFLLSVSIMCQD